MDRTGFEKSLTNIQSLTSIHNKEAERLCNMLHEYLPEHVYTQAEESVYRIIGQLSEKNNGSGDIRMGIYNHTDILGILDSCKQQCMDNGDVLQLICIDIAHLEKINRVYGYPEGDRAIRVVAQIVEGVTTGDAVAVHMTGGKFIIAVCTLPGDTLTAITITQNIKNHLDNYNKLSGREYSLLIYQNTITIQVSAERTAQSMIDEAESAMNTLKMDSRIVMPNERYNNSVSHKEFLAAKDVLDNNRLCYVFQPIVDAKSGEIYAYEALMRAQGDNSVSTLTILNYAESENRLYDVERATFNNVLKIFAEKQEQFGDRKLFINSISSHQLKDEEFEELERKYGYLFHNMIVEITEQTEIDDKGLSTILGRSERGGFGLAIDDYGTGYSNMSSLLRYLPNCVKIDHMLISGIHENPKKQHFVKNIVEFAHDNGFFALAEGVETPAELRAVIRMDIDLIQGFYTARPSAVILDEIPGEIKDEIINNNISLRELRERKVYIANGEKEIPLMILALEQYTGVVVSQPELTIIGNPDYVVGMSIKIKDGCKCRLTLRNVSMESFEGLPCIDIGKDAELTLILENNNVFKQMGIHVPDGSTLNLLGTGNLSIEAKGRYCYGIGNNYNAGVGSITCNMEGKLSVHCEGDECFGIGGGEYRQGSSGIRLNKGVISIKIAGVKGVGIGCYIGSMPINICGCSLNMDFRVDIGNAIGVWNDAQRIVIEKARIEINGSGRLVCGIGSISLTDGKINVLSASVIIKLSGQKVLLFGNEGGSLELSIISTSVDVQGEGTSVLGIGSFDENAKLSTRDATLKVDIHSADYMPIGCSVKDVRDGENIIMINEDR